MQDQVGTSMTPESRDRPLPSRALRGVRFRLSTLLLLSTLAVVSSGAVSVVVVSAASEAPGRHLRRDLGTALAHVHERLVRLTPDARDLDEVDALLRALVPNEASTGKLPRGGAAAVAEIEKYKEIAGRWRDYVASRPHDRALPEGGRGGAPEDPAGAVVYAELSRAQVAAHAAISQMRDQGRSDWMGTAIAYAPFGFLFNFVLGIVLVIEANRLKFLVSRPLEKLTEAAVAVSCGALETEMPSLPASEELERLARSVEVMRRRLVESITSLDGQNEQMTTILTTLGDGVLLLDAAGRIVERNPQADRLLTALTGRAPEMGTDIRDVLTGLPEIANEDVEWELAITPHGKKQAHYLSVRTTPVKRKNRERLHAYVAVVRDVTQEKEVERLKREFLSVVTHELKTPLTAIDGYTKLLLINKAGELNDRQRAFVTTIQTQTATLKAMIQDLLDITRIEGHTLPLDLSPLAADEVLRTAAESYRAAAESRGLVFTWDAGDLEGAKFVADSMRVQQVLGNLIGNAFKFTPKGGEVSLRGGRDGDWVTFVVRDTGRGIPPEAIPQIFTKFYQVEKGDTRVSGGAGLGLYIAKELVEAQKGRIEVSSTVGVGSTFTVRFPILAETSSSPGARNAAPRALGSAPAGAGEEGAQR